MQQSLTPKQAIAAIFSNLQITGLALTFALAAVAPALATMAAIAAGASQ